MAEAPLLLEMKGDALWVIQHDVAFEARALVNELTDYGEILTHFDRDAASVATSRLQCFSRAASASVTPELGHFPSRAAQTSFDLNTSSASAARLQLQTVPRPEDRAGTRAERRLPPLHAPAVSNAHSRGAFEPSAIPERNASDSR